jgi:hypothetical protein
MKATIENTDCIIDLNLDERSKPVQARIWKGVTEKGIPFEMAVVRVAAHEDADCAEFARDPQEVEAPKYVSAAFDLRMII